jgi:dihydrofolate reductase
VIGDHGRIPWHLSEDFAHFKATTMGGVLVMDPDWSAEGVLVAHSLCDALARSADEPGETYVVGGTQVYTQALPLATHQVLTEVDLEPDGDAHYPEFDLDEWVETSREPRDGFTWVWWERRPRD